MCSATQCGLRVRRSKEEVREGAGRRSATGPGKPYLKRPLGSTGGESVKGVGGVERGKDAGVGGGGDVVVVVDDVVEEEDEGDQNEDDEGADGENAFMELMGAAGASRRSLRVEKKAVVASAPAAALAPATATRVLMGIFVVFEVFGGDGLILTDQQQ